MNKSVCHVSVCHQVHPKKHSCKHCLDKLANHIHFSRQAKFKTDSLTATALKTSFKEDLKQFRGVKCLDQFALKNPLYKPNQEARTWFCMPKHTSTSWVLLWWIITLYAVKTVKCYTRLPSYGDISTRWRKSSGSCWTPSPTNNWWFSKVHHRNSSLLIRALFFFSPNVKRDRVSTGQDALITYRMLLGVWCCIPLPSFP